MNEAEPSPINLDELRMLPDWLREEAPSPAKQYAAHDYPLDEGQGRRGDRRSGGPGSFGGNRGDRRGAGGPPDRRREAGRSGPPPRGGGGGRGGFREERRGPVPPPPPPAQPAPVRVEFLPDERCLASINKQIRTTHLAYPLFGLARMFLQEPARHFVQFSVLPEAPAETLLYQLGDEGIITLDRATLEKQAFESAKDQFYVEETTQKEPLKGNYTNVARERLSGTLLGPTNYHGYQPALRALYDTRYSRRMSFEDFRRNVEVSTDPALIEKWKEEARTTTTIRTRVPEGETGATINSPADARNHFRQNHLESLVHSGKSFRVHGSVARTLPEPMLMQAIREAHDREMRYPAQFVQLLRQGLQNSGLHIFKHRKRVVYVSLARPTPFVAQGTVTPGVAAILATIAEHPLCTRKLLAERVLAQYHSGPIETPKSEASPQPAALAEESAPAMSSSTTTEDLSGVAPTTTDAVEASDAAATTTANESAPESAIENSQDSVPLTPTASEPLPASREDSATKAKAALAADLRFLVQAGHIIEFHNGTFDLPLPPKAKEDAPQGSRPAKTSKAGQTAGATVPALASETISETETGIMAAEPIATNEPETDVSETTEDDSTSSPETVGSGLDVPASGNNTHAVTITDESGASITIDPAPVAPAADVSPLVDKSEHDGLISGPAAAPLDLPVPGDAEDAPSSRA